MKKENIIKKKYKKLKDDIIGSTGEKIKKL